MPLVEAIEASQRSSSVEVSIVVIVVGARGVVPTFWFQNLKPLEFSNRVSQTLARQSSAAAIKGSKWIWGLWAAQAHGGEDGQ